MRPTWWIDGAAALLASCRAISPADKPAPPATDLVPTELVGSRRVYLPKLLTIISLPCGNRLARLSGM